MLTYIFVMFSTVQIIIYILDSLQLTNVLGIRNKILFFGSIFLYVSFFSSQVMILSCAYYQLHSLNFFLTTLRINNTRSLHKVIYMTSIIYDMLSDVFDEISKFSLINILIFLLGFFYFNIIFYFTLFINFKTPSDELFYFSSAIFASLHYFAPGILWLITYSNWIEQECCKTSDKVAFLIGREKSSKSFRVGRNLMQQLSHRKPKISCGLFDLNWQFFFAILSGIFTYFIILVQFHDVYD